MVINESNIDITGGEFYNIGTINNTGEFFNNNMFDNSSGIFINNGVLSSFAVPAQLLAGTISGNGSFTETPFEMVGILSPGNSPGCMTVASQDLGLIGTMNIEVNGTMACTDHDAVNNTGANITIAGASVNFSFGYTPTEGDVITFLVGSTVSGTFASVTGLTSGWTLAYDTPSSGSVSIVYSEAILPVEMTRFTGTMKGDKVQLQWQTASEANNKGYEVQRLNQDNNWERIGYLEGNGTTFLPSNYSFWDESPLDGMLYYRLLLLEFTGEKTYSKAISITGANALEKASIRPHPAVADSLLHYQTTNGGSAKLSIYGTNGEAILNRRIQLVKGKGSIPIGLNGLPKGIYVLILEHHEFKERLLVTVE
ncbi:MAG: hypothetical protein IT258_22470 [Saprospiraceae bacterium]|nr:hypothetical protein [Saprospiraceae bacterium]